MVLFRSRGADWPGLEARRRRPRRKKKCSKLSRALREFNFVRRLYQNDVTVHTPGPARTLGKIGWRDKELYERIVRVTFLHTKGFSMLTIGERDAAK